MKRSYVTPVIAVEHYNLTQSIAACDIKIGFLNSECVKKDVDSTKHMKNMAWDEWFTMEGSCIQWFENGADIGDGTCYHTNTSAAFNS